MRYRQPEQDEEEDQKNFALAIDEFCEPTRTAVMMKKQNI
jgi:hypothetical protein